MTPQSARIAVHLAAAVLATVAFGGCLARPVVSPRSTASSSPPTASGPSSPSVEVRPSAGDHGASGAPDGWRLVATGDPTVATQFGSVVAVPDGFVVTGSTGQAGETPVAVHSVDGVTWTVETLAARAGMSPGRPIAWGDRLIVSGRGSSNRCAHPGGEMDVWIRAGDATWTEAPFDPMFCSGGGVEPVIHRDRAWMIGSGVADVPFALVSDDGLAWANHRDRIGDVFIEAALSAGGELWIVGRDLDGSPVTLRSRDGTAFVKKPVAGGRGERVEVIAAVVLHDEIALLVTDGGATALLVPDGFDGWLETVTSGLPVRDLSSVEVVDGFLLALGATDSRPDEGWSSADGVSWSPVELPHETQPEGAVSGIAAANGIAVIVGQVLSNDGSVVVGAIWTGPETLLAP